MLTAASSSTRLLATVSTAILTVIIILIITLFPNSDVTSGKDLVVGRRQVQRSTLDRSFGSTGTASS